MYPFAVELWIQIIGELGKRGLISTARTCSTFRKIAQARLYRAVGFEEKNNSILFARSLAERPELASLVLKLYHRVPSQAEEDELDLFTSSPVLCHVSSFSNIQSLVLYSIRIDSGLCAALQLLPTLQAIRLQSCKIDPDMDASETQKSWGCNLSTVHLSYPCLPEAGWIAVIPATITTLHVHVRGGSFSLENLFSALSLSFPSFGFTSLALGNYIPSDIIRLLISCPQLRHLTLPRSFDAHSAPFAPLPSHSLPLLENFSGCAQHLEGVIPGRRIHTVDIHITPKDSSNTLISLRRSAIPVTKMRLKAAEIKLEWLQYIPLTVRFLEVISQFQRDLSWISALPKMPTLRTVTIHVSHVVPAAQQVELVDALYAMCNSLREMVFEWGELQAQLILFTRCTWRWRQGLPWESYISIRKQNRPS